jgi:hypothetical protein
MIPPTPRNTPAPQLSTSPPLPSGSSTTSTSGGGARRREGDHEPREVTCRTCHKRLNVRINDRGLLTLSGSVTSIGKEGKVETSTTPSVASSSATRTQPMAIPSKAVAHHDAEYAYFFSYRCPPSLTHDIYVCMRMCNSICHCISKTPAMSVTSPSALTGAAGSGHGVNNGRKPRVEVTIGINGENISDADGLLDDAGPLVRGLSFGPAAGGGTPLPSNAGPNVSGLRLRLGTSTPANGHTSLGWEAPLDEQSQRERDALFNMARKGNVGGIMEEIKRDAELRSRGHKNSFVHSPFMLSYDTTINHIMVFV